MRIILLSIVMFLFGYVAHGLKTSFDKPVVHTNTVTEVKTVTVPEKTVEILPVVIPQLQDTPQEVTPVMPPVAAQEPPKKITEDWNYQLIFRESKPAELVRTNVMSKLTGQYEMKRVPAKYTVQFRGVETGRVYPRIELSESAYNQINPMATIDRATLNKLIALR